MLAGSYYTRYMHICPNSYQMFTKDKFKVWKEQSFQSKLSTSRSGRKAKAFRNLTNCWVTWVNW